MSDHIQQLNSGVNKLQPRARGPFKIIEAVDKNVFRLELPPTWKINNSFHVSKLKLAYLNDDDKFPLRKSEVPPEPEIQKDGSVEYEVEKIVHRRKRHNRWEYRVRWRGYGPEEDTYETGKTLHRVRHLIKEYEDSLQSNAINQSKNSEAINHKLINNKKFYSTQQQSDNKEIDFKKNTN